MGEVFELDSPTKMAASAVEKLSDRDLNEVRKLPKPPELVRRALELVSALLATSEGASSLPAPGEVPWAELQKLIARDDFIRRACDAPEGPLSGAQASRRVEERTFLEHAAGTKRPGVWLRGGLRLQHPDGARPCKRCKKPQRRTTRRLLAPARASLRRRRPASPGQTTGLCEWEETTVGGHGGRGGGGGCDGGRSGCARPEW